MKVLLEGSSLFFKNYTGIPYYILNLHQSMKAQEGVDAVLGFRMKKKFGKHMPRQREILKHDHLWYLGKFMIPLLRPQVAHTLHTPFLDINRALKVATIHDMAVHLPQFREYGLASQYFVEKRFKLLGEFAKKADALITVSDATKNDFLQFFDFPEDRIHVVPLAPSTFVPQGDVPGANNILDRFKLEKKRFFLFVGGISTRKNSINLIKAYQQSKSRRDFKLVIAGNSQEIPHKVALEYIDQNNLAKDILLTGYTEKDELRALYENARAFLFPTLYEGFGIPILEAMAHGLPVLTSNKGAAPKTSGGYAILVDPLDPENIAQGIDCLDNFNDGHLLDAKNFALGHTWDRTAKLTVDVYKEYL